MRLWHRIALLSAFSIVLTAVLVMVIQSAYLSRATGAFNPAMADALTRIQTTPDLSPAAQRALLRNALRRTVADDAEFAQYVAQFSTIVGVQGRLPRLAALLSLLLVLPSTVGVAWLIAQPIRGVSQAAARIAQGDLSARVAPSWQVRGARGELADLTHNFNGMAEALGRLERERQEMIASVAHELRTPLTILQGQLDALQEGIRPLNQGALTKLNRQTQHLAGLIDDLRTLSLANAGRLTLELEAVALAPLVERVVKGFQAEAEPRSVRLSYELFVPRGVTLQADSGRLEQALSNLLGDAVHRTPAGGDVSVSLQKQGNAFELSVKDSGPTLPTDELTWAAEPWCQPGSCLAAGHTNINHTNHSSLDLTVTRALVELHGGHIRAAQPAEGNLVTVFLPAAQG